MTVALFEFCCKSGGSNLNAGTRTGSTAEPGTSADFTYASGTWVQSTRVFTVASGNPLSDGVAVGDRVSVYPDGTTPDGVYFGKVSARDATTITISTADLLGSAPSNGSSNRTLKVGGAWKGPNGTSGFPLNLITSNGGTYFPRINLKNDQTYSVTATIAAPTLASVKMQGYTTAYGDLGRATIDGGSTGASYTIYSPQGQNNHFVADIIFQNNGSTGSASLCNAGGNQVLAVRCVFRNSCGYGVEAFSAGLIECEIYNNNLNNTSGLAGVYNSGWCVHTISHDNTGSNTSGFKSTPTYRCIADTNGSHGFTNCAASGCDAYNNTGDGFQFTNGNHVFVENCNAVKNGGWGYNIQNLSIGQIQDNRYGTGTQANTSGGITIGATAAVEQIGSVSGYAADQTPWVDPANGDFRINLVAACGSGRGAFTQLGYASALTVAYPDFGAAQAKVMFRARPRMSAGGMNG